MTRGRTDPPPACTRPRKSRKLVATVAAGSPSSLVRRRRALRMIPAGEWISHLHYRGDLIRCVYCIFYEKPESKLNRRGNHGIRQPWSAESFTITASSRPGGQVLSPIRYFEHRNRDFGRSGARWFALTRGRATASVDQIELPGRRSRHPKPTKSETCSRQGLVSLRHAVSRNAMSVTLLHKLRRRNAACNISLWSYQPATGDRQKLKTY